MSTEFTLSELGQLVALFARRGHLTIAQNYLDKMQAHIDAATPPKAFYTPGIGPIGPDPVPTKTLPEIVEEIKQVPAGIVYDGDGKIIAISAQEGERGYDPDAHEKEIRIFLDGVHIETAHTADVEAGVVRRYFKNDKGRIKTEVLSGKVEIKAEIP